MKRVYRGGGRNCPMFAGFGWLVVSLEPVASVLWMFIIQNLRLTVVWEAVSRYLINFGYREATGTYSYVFVRGNGNSVENWLSMALLF